MSPLRLVASALRDALAGVLVRSTVTLTLGPVAVNVAPRPVPTPVAEPCELVRVATRGAP